MATHHVVPSLDRQTRICNHCSKNRTGALSVVQTIPFLVLLKGLQPSRQIPHHLLGISHHLTGGCFKCPCCFAYPRWHPEKNKKERKNNKRKNNKHINHKKKQEEQTHENQLATRQTSFKSKTKTEKTTPSERLRARLVFWVSRISPICSPREFRISLDSTDSTDSTGRALVLEAQFSEPS